MGLGGGIYIDCTRSNIHCEFQFTNSALSTETLLPKISSTLTLLSCKDKVSWKSQVTLTLSRLLPAMKCLHKMPKVGSTSVPLPLLDTST